VNPAAPPTPTANYYAIELTATAESGRGPTGQAVLSFAPSPFVVSVAVDGSYVYRVDVSVQGLPPLDAGAYVVWAARPDLSEMSRMGTLDPSLSVTGEVSFNKFLVFVTRETSADVTRWSGPILLRGISRSGLMHSARGHGPYAVEVC